MKHSEEFLLLFLLCVSCLHQEEKVGQSFLQKNLLESCVPHSSVYLKNLCKVSVGEHRSCYIDKGYNSVNVDCKLYDELEMIYKKEKK